LRLAQARRHDEAAAERQEKRASVDGGACVAAARLPSHRPG